MSSMKERVIQAFKARFDGMPDFIVRGPGRVNLIGEHTDYNDGFVLPMAIDRAVWIALRPRTDRTVRIQSLDFRSESEFHLDRIEKQQEGWLKYIKGMGWILESQGYDLEGWEGVVAGDVPVGAGLSSSAALELAAARAFIEVSELQWKAKDMALLAQKAENEWVGMQCGVMDQLISAAGEKGHALLIDCQSLLTKPVPLPPGTSVIVMDTATRRELVDSAYNERRASCEAVAASFNASVLRDLDAATFTSQFNQLDPISRKRARHVITENSRTLQAAEAMVSGDAKTMGQLMNESHASLRDDFEVSSPALDLMVVLAQSQSGCYGARMTGAGFGGCAVALVEQDAVSSFIEAVSHQYEMSSGLKPSLYHCEPAAGVSIQPINQA